MTAAAASALAASSSLMRMDLLILVKVWQFATKASRIHRVISAATKPSSGFPGDWHVKTLLPGRQSVTAAPTGAT